MLICDNLCVNFGDKEVLKNVSFTINEGQNLLILGENGAGKSTLAKAIIGLVRSSGTITLFGRNTADIDTKERPKLINYVPSKLESFDENLTLVDYLLMGLYPYKNRFEPFYEDERTLCFSLLSRFGLYDLRDKLLRQLSSGEQQMASTLQAAVQSSRVTIFDEPIANVDAARAKTLFSFFTSEELFGHKIIITHDLQFAFSLGYQVLYLSRGRVEFFGKAEEFFDQTQLQNRFGTNVQRCDIGIVARYA